MTLIRRRNDGGCWKRTTSPVEGSHKQSSRVRLLLRWDTLVGVLEGIPF